MLSQTEVMHSYALSESHYVDAIQGIATIKVNNKEGFFDYLNKQFYSNFQKRIFDLGILHNRYNFWSELLSTAFVITIFAMASVLVLDKAIQLGELIAILSISSGLIPSLNRLVLANIQIQEARIAFDRMYEFASIIPEDNNGDSFDGSDGGFSLKIENLSFRFPGHKLTLRDISLTIRSGEMVALSGESGSGKSTLVQILQKFYKPEAGSVEVNGRSLDSILTEAWRDSLGVVPQDVKIFNGSLLYNIALSDDPNDLATVIKFCEDFGFNEYFDRLPYGYLSIVGEEGISLSGGQKQLVALARALYKKPKFLILDEATAAMDRHTERFILELLSKLRKDIAVLLVTHKMESASLADRVYWLENGCIKEFSEVVEKV
jgi:ATP-binding cassette subfamily B protein